MNIACNVNYACPVLLLLVDHFHRVMLGREGGRKGSEISIIMKSRVPQSV